MFSYISLEERVPARHPLRKLRALVDALLASMSAEFEAVYARRGRPSVLPEMLLKALLLQILFSIRSERLLVEAIDYNLLYRWFVGLNIEDKVWDHSTFSANRERLFNEDLARVFFERVKYTAQWAKLIGDEHFSVDGTLIEAWASQKSFKRKARPTVGADKSYDCRSFVQVCRKPGITPHVAAKAKHSAIDGRTQRHEGYMTIESNRVAQSATRALVSGLDIGSPQTYNCTYNMTNALPWTPSPTPPPGPTWPAPWTVCATTTHR